VGNVCTPVWGVLRGLTGWQCMLALGLCAACVVWPDAMCACVHIASSVLLLGEARTRCAVWLFAVGSLRDFPESLAEGIYIPLCASGPQPRQFGGVCLTYEQRHHAFIHTLIHNVPDKRNEYSSPGGRRPQRAECSLHTRSLATANVRSCPTTVETCSVVSSSVIVSRDPRARVSLSFSSHRLAKQYVASFRWLLSFSRPPSSKERA
jgi:hypothetical protein